MELLKEKQISSRGITLVALIITIIVLLILAGITFQYASDDKGASTKAHEASFKTRWIAYKEQVETYTTWKIAKNMNTDISKIHAGEILLELIQKNVITDIKPEDINTFINQIIGSVNEKDKNYLVIYHGELCYVKDSTNEDAEQEAKWSNELQIPVLMLK